MRHELNKHDRKIAKILIDKGVEAEFRIALEQSVEVVKEWQQGGLDNREAYNTLFKKLRERDKRIAGRYDGLSGSRYLFTVAQIYADGQITEEDIKDFSENARAFLNTWLQRTKEEI